MTSTDPRWRTRPPDQGPVIDMTADGGFVDGRSGAFQTGAFQTGTFQNGRLPLPAKIVGVGLLVAVVAGGLGIALLALWLAFTLIPIAIAGAAIAYGVFRLQLWRARRGSLGGKRDLFRP
jgi:hypothetical protein